MMIKRLIHLKKNNIKEETSLFLYAKPTHLDYILNRVYLDFFFQQKKRYLNVSNGSSTDNPGP